MRDTLISASELEGRLDEVALFDCRFSLGDAQEGARAFRAGHIPGARHLDMETDLAGTKSGSNGRHPLPAQADFERCLQAAGVSGNSAIVLYDDNRGAGAARAWWLLRFFGHERVRILNGGLRAWRDSSLPLEHGPAPPVQAGDIALRIQAGVSIIDRPALLQKLGSPGGAIVDAREPARWAGKQEPIDPVAGRIPGALCLPWQSVTDEKGHWLDAQRLRALWLATTAADEPVVYCGSGITASVVLLARHLAGLPGGTLYPGSWSEWCSYPDCPIERDA